MALELDIPAAIATSTFQQLWDICKDKIDICRVCEYRYMCNDSRIPVQRENGSYYYLTECCYNPYIGKWHNEEGYHSLAECGIVCNKAQFAIDENQLAFIEAKITTE